MVVDDAFDLSAVDAEFAGYGPLAVTRVVPGPYRLHHVWRRRQRGWYVAVRDRQRAAPWASGAGVGLVGVPALMRVIRSSNEPASASAGQALTSAPMGPWPRPWARLALVVARMPAPRHQRARGGAGWLRRLASRMSMLAARMSPSTVKGTSRAVSPDSPWVLTSS